MTFEFTFLIGSFLIKSSISSREEGMVCWPFGLFMSDAILANILLGAMPALAVNCVVECMRSLISDTTLSAHSQ